MFVTKDTRKLHEVLYDAADRRESLLLSRREAQFGGVTDSLCAEEHGPQLVNVRRGGAPLSQLARARAPSQDRA